MNPQQQLSKHLKVLSLTHMEPTIYDKVRQWADDKGLMDNPRPEMQFTKVAEEFGEVFKELIKPNKELVRHELGDVLVTLVILAQMYGYRFEAFMFKEKDLTGLTLAHSVTSLILSGELAEAVAKQNTEKLKKLFPQFNLLIYRMLSSGIWDYNFFAEPQELLEEALEIAYTKIADRKGAMKNGVYVKEEDLS